MKRDDKMDRRGFLRKTTMAAVIGISGASMARATGVPRERTREEETMACAIIGYGRQGREIAATVARIPEVNLVAICDTYDVMRKRAHRDAPDARTVGNYRDVLDDEDVKAVIVATPTHLHREIVVEALASGKHVYCEAPMAGNIDDARAMARAARDTPDLNFHVGQQFRADPQYLSVAKFIRGGALGKATLFRGQWHTKQSWRRASPNQARERALNWRLDPDTTTGLVGEAGLHQIDTALWFAGALPTSVAGSGQIMLWNDGRTVPDTIQATLAFPGGLRMIYDAALTTSFDGSYDLFSGENSTIMIRDSKAWMFKEVDAPMLGWEVYARKDRFYREQGIALVANATKLDAQNQDPTADDPNAKPPLFHALQEFADNYFYGPFEPSAGYRVGFEAAVVAFKAHEAILNNATVDINSALFALN